MKVLRIIYDFADSNNFTGGLSPAPYELSLAQSALNNKIYVLCGNLNKKNLLKKRFFYKINENILVYNLPRGLPHFGPFLTTSVLVPLYYLYFKFRHKIDLVHNHQHLGVWLLLYKYIFGFIDKTPFIGHFHVTAKGREESILSSGVKLPLFTKYFEYPIHKFSDFLQTRVCKHLFCVSENIKEEVINFYKVDSSKITVIESAVSIEKFTKDIKKINLNYENGSIILGYVGRISKRKGIDIMLETLKSLPEVYKLVLWGEFQDLQYKKHVEHLVEKFKLQSRFSYKGAINYFENQNAFSVIDIFLIPSSYEGLPKVILEALVSHCYVIASGFKIKEDIPNLKFLEKIDPTYLTKDVLEAKLSEENYKKTLNIIRDKYSYENRAEQIQKIYISLK